MDITLSLAELMGLAGAAAAAVSPVLLAAVKLLMGQMQRILVARFEAIEGHIKRIEDGNREEVSHWRRVERDLQQLREQLPLHYVRREDYIRGQSIIEAKLDGLAVKIENAQLRRILGESQHD